MLKRISLYTSQVAHQAGAYLGFCDLKRLPLAIAPPRGDGNVGQFLLNVAKRHELNQEVRIFG